MKRTLIALMLGSLTLPRWHKTSMSPAAAR